MLHPSPLYTIPKSEKLQWLATLRKEMKIRQHLRLNGCPLQQVPQVLVLALQVTTIHKLPVDKPPR